MKTEIPANQPQKVVITANRIRIVDDSVIVGSPRLAFARHEPNVNLIREDGVIRAFEVVCGCGEKVRVKCDYS